MPLLVIALGVGCGSGSPTSPTAQGPRPPIATPGPLPSAQITQWVGSATVEATSGVAPACVSPFWRPGVASRISVDFYDRSVGMDLALREESSQVCHMQVGMRQDQITGTPWPYDEFDCAVVPSLCDLGCHFRLNSTEWSCPGAAPDVWILGISLVGRYTDASQTRIEGTMNIGYDHRPGDSPAVGPYTNFSVVKKFQLSKVAP
jgi:hypothetical protein